MHRVDSQGEELHRALPFRIPSAKEALSHEWQVLPSPEGEEGVTTIITGTGKILTLHPSTALVLAAKAHQYKAVKALTNRYACLVESVALAQIELRALEEQEKEVSQKDVDLASAQIKLRGCVLAVLVEEGTVLEVTEFLERGPVTDRARSVAFVQAIKCENMAVARYLLKTGEVLRDEILKDLVESVEGELLGAAADLLSLELSLSSHGPHK